MVSGKWDRLYVFKKFNVGVLRQSLAALCAAMSIFSVSSSFVWITPLLVGLQKNESPTTVGIQLSSDEASWVVSLIEVGDLISTIPVGFLVDRIGRKPLLLATGPMFIFSWLLVLSTRSVLVLYIVRIIQGLALGMLFTGLPLYVAEIAGPKIRGAMGYFFQGMWYVGNLYEYSIGPFVSYQTLALLSMIPPIVFVVTFSWFPESPYLLKMRGRHEEAAASLRWFRGSVDPSVVETELAQMSDVTGTDQDANSRLNLIRTKAGIKSLLIVHMVGMTYTMSGGTAMFSYASETFSKTAEGHSGGVLSPDIVTVVMGCLVLMFVPLSAAVVDRFGRRPILLTSSAGSFLSLALAALYYYLRSSTSLDLSSISWSPYVLIVAYTIFIGSGVESVFPVLQAELFPDSTRGVASGVCHFNITLMSFFCLKMYKVIADGLGRHYLYAIFSLFALLGTVLIYFCVPETKGKSFNEIQDLLK